MQYKVPPHDLEAEAAVLGACILNPSIVAHVRKTLNPDDFYREAHTLISEVIFDLKDKTTIITLADRLRAQGFLEKAGGNALLMDIAEHTATSAAWEYHSQIVKTKARSRRIISQCSNAIERAFSGQDEPGEILNDLKEELRHLISEDVAPYRQPVEVLKEIFADIEERAQSGKTEVGVKTGFKGIDFHMNGLEPRTTIYLAGRPSMGKTALALNIAENVAANYDGLVPYFTGESGDTMLMRRRVASDSTVFYSRIRSGRIDEGQWPMLVESVDNLSKTNNFIIIDKPKFKTVEHLAALCEAEALDNPISLVVIDHLHVMRTKERTQSLNHQFSVISEKLQDLAKELNAPLLILAQLSRKLEERKGDKQAPRLDDLRESGTIEQNADVVIGLYRKDKTDETLQLEGLKGRDIGLWKSYLTFNQNIQRFYDVGEE